MMTCLNRFQGHWDEIDNKVQFREKEKSLILMDSKGFKVIDN